MFILNEEDLSIYVTRGDTVFFTVMAEENGEPYYFEAGDVLRMKVFSKKKATDVVLEKCFPITARTDRYTILLTEEDTKIGEVISKPKDYWYEVELNPFTNPQTIIGYDEDGAKIFKLFPEGADSDVVDPDPEDIPIVDDELDMTSPRPVQNRAIARAVVNIAAACKVAGETSKENTAKLNATESRLKAEIAVERTRITNLASIKAGSTSGDAELTDARHDGITVHGNVGAAIRAKTAADFEMLKATKLAQPVIPFMDRLEIGFVKIESTGLTFSAYTNYVRTKEAATIHLEAGDTVVCSNETRVYTGYLSSGEYIPSGWTSTFAAPVEADYVMLFSKYDLTDIEDLDGFLENIVINRADNYSKRIAEVKEKADHLWALDNTYLSKCDFATGDATTTNANRFCAKLESPVKGVKLTMAGTLKCGIQGYTDSSYSTKTYDSGWLKESDFILFDNPELYYVLVFIRADEGTPTTEDKSNTEVLQALDLTPILDKLNNTANTLTQNEMVRSVAHRGLSASAPENTAPAFVLAKQAGFTYVETDIQVTKDGKYVCVHDGTISKYTAGVETGAVADYTLEELQAMDFGAWKDAKWAGTRILTFEEVVLLCKKLGLKLYVELKYTHSEADISYYMEYVKRMGMAENCVWRGASYNAVIRKLSDSAVIAYDASSIMTEEKVKSIVADYSPMFFHNDYSYVTEDVVALCHNNGVRIEAYTVNDEATLEDMAAMGVDGITTDKLVAGKVFFESLM